MDMNEEERNNAKREIAKILREYDITSGDDYDAIDEETGSMLYESFKAGVLEEFDIEETEMDELLEEVLEEFPEED